MRAAQIPLLLLLVPLLGGCMTQGDPHVLHEVCLEHGYRLQWRQPDLREPLLAAAEREGFAITSQRDAVGLPFVERSLGLDAGEAQVGFAAWRPDGGGPTNLLLALGAAPNVDAEAHWLEADNLQPGTEGIETLRGFLSWFGLDEHPDAESWLRDLADQMEREPGQRGGNVVIRAQPDFGAFYAMLRAEGAPEVEHEGMGTMGLHWPKHTLLLHLDLREVVIPVDGTRLRVQVDSMGMVSATTTAPEPAQAHVTLVERTERVFADLALPKPTWNGAMGAGVGC